MILFDKMRKIVKKHRKLHIRNNSSTSRQNTKTTIVYTDGSAINNGKSNARGGIGVYFADRDKRNSSEPFFLKPITNIRVELYAVIRAIQNFAQQSDWNPATQGFIRTRKYFTRNREKSAKINNKYKSDSMKNNKNKVLHIYTDSQFVIDAATKWIHKWKKNGWKTIEGKPIQNQDLIVMLDELTQYYRDKFTVMFSHVKSHRNPPSDKKSEEYQHWLGNELADKLSKMTYYQQFHVRP